MSYKQSKLERFMRKFGKPLGFYPVTGRTGTFHEKTGTTDEQIDEQNRSLNRTLTKKPDFSCGPYGLEDWG